MSKVLYDSDLNIARLLLSLAEFFWAVLLLWPGETFARPTYYNMRIVMPEEAWGAVFLLSSVTQLKIVLLEDQHTRFARYFAGWNMVLWVWVSVMSFMSVSPPPAAMSGDYALTIMAIWICVRPYVLSDIYTRAKNAPRNGDVGDAGRN